MIKNQTITEQSDNNNPYNQGPGSRKTTQFAKTPTRRDYNNVRPQEQNNQ